MLKPVPWANAMALTTAFFFLILMLIEVLAPNVFTEVYRAQFLGADVKFTTPSPQEAILTLVTLLVTTWIFGFVWAKIYNKLIK